MINLEIKTVAILSYEKALEKFSCTEKWL